MAGPPDDGPGRADLLRWSEALAGIARTGLGFTESLYEQERFEEVLKVAADIRAAADDEALAEPAGSGGKTRPAGSGGKTRPGGSGGKTRGAGSGGRWRAYEAEWLRGVGSGVPGYVTPKVAIGAVVGDDEGRLLLVQRADSGVWLYPTGWADIGYSPAEVAVKEVHEETGITCEPVRLIAVLDGLRLGFTSVPLYSLVFHCRATGGELCAHPLETKDVGWFPEDGLPSPLAGFERWGPGAFAAIRGEPLDVLFDPVRDPIWRDDV